MASRTRALTMVDRTTVGLRLVEALGGLALLIAALSVGGAIANAIYNATGVRVRHYPITLDKLIERLPQTV